MYRSSAKTKTTYATKEANVFNVFSKWLRESYEINGLVRCYTCDAQKPLNEMHAGHCISRQNRTLMFDFDNVRPQCYTCNINLGGNRKEFERRLNREQDGKVQDLKLRGKELTKRDEAKLDAMRKTYNAYRKGYSYLIGGKVYEGISKAEKFKILEQHFRTIRGDYWQELEYIII